LKRVFNIAIEICEYCGGTVKIIASIQDPAMIKTMLARLATARAHHDQGRQPGPLDEARRLTRLARLAKR
jgi:hypothetical protein